MSKARRFRKGCIVMSIAGARFNDGIAGLITRVAKDGSWADTVWTCGYESWSKRMRTEYLVIYGQERNR